MKWFRSKIVQKAAVLAGVAALVMLLPACGSDTTAAKPTPTEQEAAKQRLADAKAKLEKQKARRKGVVGKFNFKDRILSGGDAEQ
jgi:hypothetical protein